MRIRGALLAFAIASLAVGLIAPVAGAATRPENGDATTTTKAAGPKVKPAKKVKKKTSNAKKFEAEFVKVGAIPVKQLCTPSEPGWSCFYDHITAPNSHQINIYLTGLSGTPKDVAGAYAKQARTTWFNFVGPGYPKLDTIVTYVDGLDVGYTRRDSVPILNR